MEKCIYYSNINFNTDDFSEYHRIYVGEEFCDNYFLKSLSNIKGLIYSLYQEKKPFSLILPVVNESNFSKFTKFIDSISDYFDDNAEIICNDPGMMNCLNRNGFSITSGRFLTRLFMGIYIKDKSIFNQYSLDFIKRVEIDSTSIKYLEKLNFDKISFYSNYSASCLSNNRCCFRTVSNKIWENSLCSYECESKVIPIRNKYCDDEFLLYRNTILQENQLNIQELIKVNRVIYYKI